MPNDKPGELKPCPWGPNELRCGIDWSNGEDYTCILFARIDKGKTIIEHEIHLTPEETKSLIKYLDCNRSPAPADCVTTCSLQYSDTYDCECLCCDNCKKECELKTGAPYNYCPHCGFQILSKLGGK